jgi:AcrR family transcriptional regulator
MMPERGRPRNFDKQEALSRAMDVFWEKGYEGASMAELTAAMGINAPSLYAAFGSKENLFREALSLYVSTEGEELLKPVLEAPTAYSAIERLLMESARVYTRKSRPSGCLVVLSALQGGSATDAVRGELSVKRMQNVGDLAKLLARGVQAGEIARAADLKAIARFYITVQQGMSIQARDGASRAALEAVARAALAAWPALTKAD